MFFKTIPKTKYSFPDLDIRNITCVDIFKRISIDFNENRTRSFDYYTIKPGDTPEILSSKSYNGSPYWYWAILLFNEVVNPFKEFARSSDVAAYNTASQYNAMGSFFYDDDVVVFPDFTKTRNLREGDIIIKINSDGTLPDPYTTSTVSVQIVYVDNERREMRFLTDSEIGVFSEDDTFAVIDFTDNEYSVVFKSKILKRYSEVSQGVSFFKDPDGNSIPTTTLSPSKPFPTKQPYLTAKFNDTIVGEFLDAQSSGPWTTSELKGYTVMSVEDAELEKQFIKGRIKIPDARLLQPLLTKLSKVMKKPPTHNEEMVKSR